MKIKKFVITKNFFETCPNERNKERNDAIILLNKVKRLFLLLLRYKRIYRYFKTDFNKI